jgi:hypothetical protein
MTAAEVLAREQAKAKRQSLEMALLQQLRAAGLATGMVREWAPFEDVGYRFDFAWPELRPVVLVEVEGSVWTKGAHSTGRGITRDIEKGNRAVLAGYALLRATGDHVKSGQALRWIERMVRP